MVMTPRPFIALFDIPSTLDHQPWNPNTWKARAVLNYKRLPYKTIWLSYPDIESTLKKLGAPARAVDPQGKPHYMLPAILDTSGVSPILVTDSLNIAEYLEEKYPERPIFPKDGKALEYAFEETFNRIVGPPMWKMMLPLAWNILDERSQKYFCEKRERWNGSKVLDKWCPEAHMTEKDWNALMHGFNTLAAILDMNGPSQKFVAGGTEPTRADLIIVSYLASIIVAAPEKWNEEVRHWSNGRWEKLWKLSEPWRVIH
ncbi:hypothetical protein K439DRAFT_1639384 [Ramaria rubella]|nr:hypothetical protein K439DRAFT_1639384 [Ramaria rubella]